MTDKEKLDAVRAEIHRLVDVRGYDRKMANDLFAFMDSLPNEPVSEDLEEVCEQLAENARKHKAETSSPFFSQTDYRQGVMDGAKWQKTKMMSNAIDGEVLENYDGKVLEYDDLILDEKLSNCKVFDKVKIIVIKED